MHSEHSAHSGPCGKTKWITRELNYDARNDFYRSERICAGDDRFLHRYGAMCAMVRYDQIDVERTD